VLGDQQNLPASLAMDNKAKNTYYFLPLLLGLLGIVLPIRQRSRGQKGVWVVFLLFFMTGLAIVIYLNQYPHQPRERDLCLCRVRFMHLPSGLVLVFLALPKD
jgi:hypothetical protein